MRIVIDTNVVASAIFFGGKPAKLLKLVLLRHPILAVATSEILEEYQTTIDYLLKKYNGKKLNFTMIPLFRHSKSSIRPRQLRSVAIRTMINLFLVPLTGSVVTSSAAIRIC